MMAPYWLLTETAYVRWYKNGYADGTRGIYSEWSEQLAGVEQAGYSDGNRDAKNGAPPKH